MLVEEGREGLACRGQWASECDGVERCPQLGGEGIHFGLSAQGKAWGRRC